MPLLHAIHCHCPPTPTHPPITTHHNPPPQVYYGTWRGQAVAIKVLNPQSADSAKLMSEFNREVSTMTRLPEHPNVLKLLGVCTTPPNLALVTT